MRGTQIKDWQMTTRGGLHAGFCDYFWQKVAMNIMNVDPHFNQPACPPYSGVRFERVDSKCNQPVQF